MKTSEMFSVLMDEMKELRSDVKGLRHEVREVQNKISMFKGAAKAITTIGGIAVLLLTDLKHVLGSLLHK